ncbi:MAG TPA: biotin--[acetyl-CoA-carboxylase] ligase, partial [Candidatus Nitrosotenuis sp.]|nr:biotin--[acetyl-CoA-carboxylase] ligase [Candidatus Nitrosotenuis sp.]
IWMSVVLDPNFDISKITLIPLAAAIALHDAILKSLNLKTDLKWPNDVTLNGDKVAGIVIDATVESSNVENMILGIGINFRVNPKEIEKRIVKKQNFYGVGTLVDNNSDERPSKLVQSFLEELEKTLERLDNTIISKWTKRSSTIGRNVTISTQNGKIAGIATRLDRDGSLIVSQGSRQSKITVGDVSYR